MMRWWLAGLVALQLAFSARAGAAPDVQTSGFGLFRYTPPGWAWAPVPDGVAVSLQRTSGGTAAYRFQVPEHTLAGLDPAKARVGIVTGMLGTEPQAWVPIAGEYRAPEGSASTGSDGFGGAALQSASATLEGGRLTVDVMLDGPPALTTGWDLYLYVDTDGHAETGFLGGDYLIQNTALGPGGAPSLQVAWFTIRPGIVRSGERAAVTAVLHNATASALPRVSVDVRLPTGIASVNADRVSVRDLQPGETRRLTWSVRASAPGAYRLRLTADAAGQSAARSQWLTVVAKRDARHEFENAAGAWAAFPARPTLQQGNRSPIEPYRSRPSSRLKRNLFGITAHLPRSTDLEQPFRAGNAADSDPETCWASRWWRTAVPFTPEWIEGDLGAVRTVGEVRFLPAWRNSGVPADFTIEVSRDRRHWSVVAAAHDYHVEASSSPSDRVGDRCWQRFTFSVQPARYVRLQATRLTQGGTSFFCAPYEPFQLRVAEIAAVTPDAAILWPKAVRVSSTHTAWYNDPASIRKSWPLELASGVKLNRISQWGDKTDWASVERERGVYRIDPEVDRGIDQSVRAGVDILLTLDYGNNLYGQLRNAPDWGPTWHYSHPFLQCAPTSPEGLEAWAKWCGFMAGHFRGRVKYFEIWNEENGWFFDDWAKSNSTEMVRAYGKALLAAARAVKEANPEAKVVFGGTAGMTLDFPRIALAEGAGRYIDVFAFHPYGHPTPEAAAPSFLTYAGDQGAWQPRPAGIVDYEGEIAALRDLLHRYNPNMQIWADEMNWFAPGEPAMSSQGDQSELSQAKYLARFFGINAWLGCGAIWWSLYNANHIQEWAVVRTSDGTPRAAYHAAGCMATVLDDADGAPDVAAHVEGPAPADLLVKAYRNGRGDTIIGLWRTAPTNDACVPVPVTVRIPAAPARRSATLVDVVYGYGQPAQIRKDGSDMLVPGVLVGDWPVYVVLTR